MHEHTHALKESKTCICKIISFPFPRIAEPRIHCALLGCCTVDVLSVGWWVICGFTFTWGLYRLRSEEKVVHVSHRPHSASPKGKKRTEWMMSECKYHVMSTYHVRMVISLRCEPHKVWASSFEPPQIVLLIWVCHPNVDPAGGTCVPVLKLCTSSPSLIIVPVLTSVQFLMWEPSLKDPTRGWHFLRIQA